MVFCYQPTVVEQFRQYNQAGRPTEDWLAEMATLPKMHSYNYWITKEGDLGCLVKDQGVYFGHVDSERQRIDFDTFTPQTVLSYPPALRPTFLEPYTELIDCLLGKRPMSDLFVVEGILANPKQSFTSSDILKLVAPAKQELNPKIHINWEKLWTAITRDSTIRQALANTSHTKEKDFNRPLVANIINLLRTQGILNDYNASQLAQAMGYSYETSFRQALCNNPKDEYVKTAVLNILQEISADNLGGSQ